MPEMDLDGIRVNHAGLDQAEPVTLYLYVFRNREALGWYDTLFAGVAQVYLFQPPSHGATTHAQLTQTEIAARIVSGLRFSKTMRWGDSTGLRAIWHLGNATAMAGLSLRLSSPFPA